MKRILALLLLPAILLLMGGCSKDFLTDDDQVLLTRGKLDELAKKPTVAAEMLQAKIDGIYTAYYRNQGSGGRDDFARGLRYLHLQTDYTTNEIVYIGHNWGYWDYRRGFFEPPYSRVNQTWKKIYEIIGMINPIINDNLPKEGEEISKAIAPIYGQVYGLRGISYYYLVNYFRRPYVLGSKDEPCVPLVLTGDIEETKKQATVEEIYQQVISDLEKGAEYAGDGNAAKTTVNKHVCHAYLTKVYMERGDWENAIKHAKEVFDNRVLPKPFPNAYAMEFSNLAQEDMMWGYTVNAETTLFWSSFYCMVDPTTSGYSRQEHLLGYNALVDELPDSDLRKQWFSPGFPSTNTPEFRAFADKWGGVVHGGNIPYLFLKYHSPTDWTGDVVYIRYSDTYLMLLEAMYENGEADAAKDLLERFVKLRDPNYSASSLEGEAIRDEIRFQRRIELIGEGASWYDYRRWQILLSRKTPGKYGPSNHLGVWDDIEPGSAFYAYPIPEREMLQNRHFNSSPSYIP